MTTQQEVFEALTGVIQQRSPKFKVIAKKDSRLHRFIDWCLRCPWIKGKEINPHYMTKYWTTIGHTVAYPNEEREDQHYHNWSVLPHEGKHSFQAKKWSSFLFGTFYLLGTPVYFIAMALLCWPFFIWLPWWSGVAWLGAGLLLSIPPFGYWRARWELQAFRISIALRYWRRAIVDNTYLESIADHFTKSDYFWMWPFRKSVLKRLDHYRNEVTSGAILRADNPDTAYLVHTFRTLQKYHRVHHNVPSTHGP